MPGVDFALGISFARDSAITFQGLTDAASHSGEYQQHSGKGRRQH